MFTACQVAFFAGCLALALSCVQAQFFYHQALGLPSTHSFEPANPYQGYATADAHPSVVRNAQWESELPAELSKSARFYNDPVVAANLAKASLLTTKEMAVVHREAEKIPRDQVYKLFKNAGWLSRR
ncbi:GL15072 [Drosophila persimilis]|uniref:Uncharacterized protein n=2 Tax=pseudoobscura subgroup TaxID=32358 RepID=Q29F48_DROPS|nr:uncharacterized protein LOC4813988 [Drosophila pseudoobscura]XP_002028026.1 uncharacterized protein LOC6602999 [Drosophila persimilis]XP_015042530.1 uncharacterized protein LOC4813988 [Drosophila pseudoobscura]XP_017135739.1 uncharacterized protein LOC108151575 [Drosophila miranda]XP_017135740.1 uncharacterized protein LOC108151575 [Drosophila miranda]EDW37791.1 GL15072 [Drosophila persimilis]